MTGVDPHDEIVLSATEIDAVRCVMASFNYINPAWVTEDALVDYPPFNVKVYKVPQLSPLTVTVALRNASGLDIAILIEKLQKLGIVGPDLPRST